MNEIRKYAIFLLGSILIILTLTLGYGAVDAVKRGSGFLILPSFTPTATRTPTLTPTPTATATVTPTLIPTATDTAVPIIEASPVIYETQPPIETAEPVPTYNETALAEKIYAEITASSVAYVYLQTPSATPVIPDGELYSGLRMVNPVDQKVLYYVRTEDIDGIYGFWMDWNEVSNEEYSACVSAGYCSLPNTNLSDDKDYFENEEYRSCPVVNVTRGQAAAYCSWAGMLLPSLQEWDAAAETFPKDDMENVDLISDGPRQVLADHSDLFGNVWEWLQDDDETHNGIIAGGSWKTAVQDIRNDRKGKIRPNEYYDDLGFRCLLYVKR